MSLRFSYTLLAPIYDTIVAKASENMRKTSIDSLKQLTLENSQILIVGIGSGLDIPFLPSGPKYIGLDITPAMLSRARHRVTDQKIKLEIGDATKLPYPAQTFDAIVMHLILAVVPNPKMALIEAERVLKPGGLILVADKFLRTGQLALVRRLISPLIGCIATRTDVVFEDLLAETKSIKVVHDHPQMLNGWFRRILLTKQAVD